MTKILKYSQIKMKFFQLDKEHVQKFAANWQNLQKKELLLSLFVHPKFLVVYQVLISDLKDSAR